MDSLSPIEIKLLQAALPLFFQMKPFDDYEGEGNAPYWLNFWNHLRFSSEGDIGDVSASLSSVTTSPAKHPTPRPRRPFVKPLDVLLRVSSKCSENPQNPPKRNF